jgi:LAO/AO transport system kinase
MLQALHKQNNVAALNFKVLAKSISIVENEAPGYYSLLENLSPSGTKIIGITGPPGAGKSTLTDALIETIINDQQTVGVLCVDPSSPFNKGALLGDRIRLSCWYNHPSVFIRSLASRGNLGGLHPKIIEITDVMKASSFDYIIIETVGVGQSEVEIAFLADATIVVLVPEAGDEIQNMKAGLMEIADVFVVNKSDRPDADTFAGNIKMMLMSSAAEKINIPVIKTIATTKTGIDELMAAIENIMQSTNNNEKKHLLLAEKAYRLIANERMRTVDKNQLLQHIKTNIKDAQFNLYKFVKAFSNQS